MPLSLATASGDGATALCSRRTPLLLALGVISSPDYHARRMAQRHSWMRWPTVGHGPLHEICPSFVVRAGHAPRGVSTALQRELEVHKDILLVGAVGWNESRVRGPILSLAWWLLHAAQTLQHAHFVGKLDDDAYIHAPDLQQLLSSMHLQFGPSTNVYMGVQTWYHWYPSLFDNTRHGWSFRQAFRAGRECKSRDLPLGAEACGGGSTPNYLNGSCGRCEGPFAFSAGYLIVVSFPLVDGLQKNRAIASEAERLALRDPARMRSRSGKPLEQVMEDVWLGSLLYRFPLKQTVRYVSLVGDRKSALYVDQWDFRLARSAFLYHIITKHPERYLALHDYMRKPGMHCSRNFEIRCNSYCATRARYAQPIMAGQMSEGCNEGVEVADEWCIVHTRASPGSDEQAPCCGLPSKSCTAVFGSNKWLQPYKSQLPLHRFRPVAKDINLTSA